jgi:hypothetical protein
VAIIHSNHTETGFDLAILLLLFSSLLAIEPKSLHFLILNSFFFGRNFASKRKDLLSKEAKVDERERERERDRERESQSFHISPHQSPPNFNFLYLAPIQELFISKPYFLIISNNRI